MASSGVNVFRWSALAFGVFYGFSHQSAIYSSDKKAAAQHEWDRKVKLIDDAKAKYAEKSRPGSGDGVITNPEDPKFDLEKYLNKVSKESP
ncbi:ATP synthase E chain-domain-containing protein [Neohortaea acidophila]|uniref:ATP synthase F(0) complex subunit e, mitochondrial n=1 Tax=Neohortaea acidophila TaxID=245834 RepID=A0A6A6PM71_9PEZI|nr:ATP synthase E chain-domain-containing protein [Neohortaea acidophila]KAF2480357.1 ATP synthase E chain-domain-containing protein [Neohortaea acidophila]